MKNKVLSLGVFLLFFSNPVISQNTENINSYKFLGMLSLFSEGLNNKEVEINKESLIKFFTINVEMSIIDQNSFNDFVFLKIDPKSDQKVEKESTDPIIWSDSSCSGYILAINKGSNYTFKLKGYQNNDFHSFLTLLKKSDYKNLNSANNFSKNYMVEGLDFNCLYKSLRLKNKEDFNKYDCLSDTCLKIYQTHNFE